MTRYLTDLADVCRTSGLRVIEVPGWRARGHGGMTSVRGVICHWTATPDTTRPSEPYPSLGIVRDGRTGLPGPLANVGLGRDGTVYCIAAGLAYHAGVGYWPGIGSNGNAHAIGIEAEEGGDGDWTAAMIDAYPRLVAALQTHYRFPAGNAIGHHEWSPGRKIDIRSWPGGMAAFRRTVSTVLSGPPPRHLMEDDIMYVKCAARGTAILSGPIFVGLGTTGELSSADAAIAKGAPVQWVEEWTWDDLDRRSKALYNTGLPVRVVEGA